MAAAILVMRFVNPQGKPIPGDSTYAEFPQWIQIEGWSWDVASTDDKVTPHNVRVTKNFDSASTALMVLLDTTTVSKEVEIVVWEGSQDSALQIRVTLSNVTITNLTSNVKTSEGGGSVEETWDFGYTEINFKYYSPEADDPDVKFGDFVQATFTDVNPHEQGSTKANQEKTREFERIFHKMSTVEQDEAVDRLRKIAAGHIDPTKDSPNPALPQRTSTILRGRDNETATRK